MSTSEINVYPVYGYKPLDSDKLLTSEHGLFEEIVDECYGIRTALFSHFKKRRDAACFADRYLRGKGKRYKVLKSPGHTEAVDAVVRVREVPDAMG